MKEFLEKDVVKVAEQYPGVEVVVRRKENHHPHVKGIYGAFLRLASAARVHSAWMLSRY